jgi:protein Mpv17
MSSESADLTLLSGGGGSGAAVATNPSKKKVVGVTVSSVLFALLMASTASRRLIADCVLSLLASYKVTMVRNPLETKVVTGVILAVLGDALAQMRAPSKPYDTRRAASFAAFDSCYRFFQHNAFPFIISICQGNVLGALFSSFPGLVVGANLRLGLAALERTLVYQLVVIPLLYYPIFFTFTGYLQGLKPAEIMQRARTSFLPCWKRNLMFWIPTQMVMFGLIDEKWQIPFACVMGMLWSTILSVTAGNAKAGSEKKA